MFFKNKIKLFGLVVIAVSVASLLVHLVLANYSTGDLIEYKHDNFYQTGQILHHRNLWGSVIPLEALQPYAIPRDKYPVLSKQNGYIYAKIYGGFEKIRSSICDLVIVARLLNATLVIPEIQGSLHSKGISSKFKSFSYIFNEDQFIEALSNDILVVKSLPKDLKEARKNNFFPTVSTKRLTSVNFYFRELLPKLRQSKAVGLLITDGGCLPSILPPSMVEYQRLRCRVAFHALQFRPEIQALGNQIVERLRALGRPYLAFHPGLVRDTLAFHGCAELFQDVHSELIQHRRAQMITRGIVRDKLSIDSVDRKRNGSCPLMPEEVGLLLRAIGYPPNTIIYLAGSETFGGQRVLMPLRAMYANLVDQTSLCGKKELSKLFGRESYLSPDFHTTPPGKSEEQLITEWMKAGPRPRPLPPPSARPVYRHEKEGWYGWVTETEKEPNPSLKDLRREAHRLLWDALDYHVSVEADAFFPGFHNDGSGWPDFSSLVMGHRLYQMPSSVTYRPDRKALTKIFDMSRDNLYHSKRNWTAMVREHLNKSLGVDGLAAEAQMSKPTSFLSHPLPECACVTSKLRDAHNPVKGRNGKMLRGGEDECPEWMRKGLAMVLPTTRSAEDDGADENSLPEDDTYANAQLESEDGSKTDAAQSAEQEEMDTDD